MSDVTSVMLAAGGTGGHLFPAFALAEELQRRGIAVDLITDMRGDRYGSGFPARTVYQVPAATLAGRSPVAAAKTVLALARGTKAAHAILGQVKPAAVIGFGGYPTYPPLAAARLRGIPSALHEQNAVLGRANRLLAKGATAIATSFEHVKLLDGDLAKKAVFTGNPVRSSVVAAAARPFEPIVAGGPVRLLVFGGSQGARFFSDAVPPALEALPAALKARLHVVQQARDEDVTRVEQAYAAAGIAAEVAPFFKDLPERMAASHLVIGRAGASTVAELTVIGRPSLLVPLPHALDNDQLNNARRLAETGGGWCIEQKELTGDRLAREIASVLNDPQKLASAAAAAKRAGRPDAVERLADFVLALAGRSSIAPGRNDLNVTRVSATH
jgi:UDP-N-acetylglucosamine--N-acetylmuramyl-(pentapeptide) pyrophosphoryl-undecaprenol N-acetylglucosamine transferase